MLKLEQDEQFSFYKKRKKRSRDAAASLQSSDMKFPGKNNKIDGGRGFKGRILAGQRTIRTFTYTFQIFPGDEACQRESCDAHRNVCRFFSFFSWILISMGCCFV